MTQEQALQVAQLILPEIAESLHTNLDRSVYADRVTTQFYIFGGRKSEILASSEESWEGALLSLKTKHGKTPPKFDRADNTPEDPRTPAQILESLEHVDPRDPDWCYYCDRPKNDCACHLDPNGPPVQ